MTVIPIDANKGDQLASFDPADFPSISHKQENWRYLPLKRLRGLDTVSELPQAVSPQVTVECGEGATHTSTAAASATRGSAGVPRDKIAALAYTHSQTVEHIKLTGEHADAPITRVNVQAPGASKVAFGHLVIEAAAHARATVTIHIGGNGTLADNVEFIIGDGADISVVVVTDCDDQALYLSGHHVSVGRDATIRHTVATLGGETVRIIPVTSYTSTGGNAEMRGIYFADEGQHFEHQLLIDHSTPHCRSLVDYRGALGGGNTTNPAHTVWIGDVLIRAEAEGTDTYEINRNIVLADGAQADSIPNLEIETGEIVGAGHATTTGRFDDEQVFYLRARGIEEDVAKRLIIRGFFAEIIDKIPDESVRESLTEAIDAELLAISNS